MGSILYKNKTYAGIAKHILGNFADIEVSPAVSAHGVGSYVLYNERLYKVTTAIAIGDTLTPGTNIVKTTVGDEVKDRVLWWASQSIASTSGNSGTLLTITDPRITADHVLDKFEAANPSYITADVTCTTSAGQAVFTGKSSAATTAEIKLTKKDN